MNEYLILQPIFAEYFLRFERMQGGGATLALIAFILSGAIIWYLYRKMDREISKRKRILLTLLRLIALLGLLLIYMRPEPLVWRDRSRIALLCDTSASMGINDDPVSQASGNTRLDLARLFLSNEANSQKTIRHDLSCYTFDSSLSRPVSIDTSNPFQLEELRKWQENLRPSGSQTRLADSLMETISREENRELAAVLLLSDGCNNIGTSTNLLLERLKSSPCPVHVVAVGKHKPQFEFGIKGLRSPNGNSLRSEIPIVVELESQGSAEKIKNLTREQTLDLFLIPRRDFVKDVTEDEVKRLIGNAKANREIRFYLNEEGQLGVNPAFQASDTLSPTKESRLLVQGNFMPTQPGRFVLIAAIRKTELQIDGSPLAFREIEIFDKKEKVLLMTGGPGRDFQFIESRMSRTSDPLTDVYLMAAKRFYRLGKTPRGDEDERVDMEDSRLTPKFLAQYDTIIAFDPDWKNSITDQEASCLEQWVAREGGGLIVTAGPVFAGEMIDGWTQSPAMKNIRILYPVLFFPKGESLAYDSTSPRARSVQLTSKKMTGALFPLEGEDDSFRWSEFPGFFGILPVKAVKPTATLWAALLDSEKTNSGENALKVLFASQWFGAGRVFYIGNSELWRMRTVEESALERLFMRLMQYVSQGRRERTSPYGRISVDREEYEPGMNVAVQAIVNDLSFRPLAMEKIILEIEQNGHERFTHTLTARHDMTGVYQGDFVVSKPGTCRLDLPVPGTNEVLTTTFRVEEYDRERPPSYCNTTVLREIARVSGGTFFEASAISQGEGMTFLNTISPKSREPVADENMQRAIRTAILILICACVLTEWLIRRITGLA